MPDRSPPDLARAIAAWQISLEASGKAPATVKAYTDAAALLEHAFGAHADPATITIDDLELVMATWRRLKPTTRRNRLIAWRQFYAWGARRHGWPNTPAALDLPRRSKAALRRLTEAEVDAMLDARAVERARTVVWLLAYTAARVSELLRLRWGDVDLVAGRVTISDEAKGARGRVVPIPDALVAYLAGVKDTRGIFAADDAYLVPHRRRAQFIPEDEAIIWNAPTSQMTIGRILKAIAEQAGVRAPGEITAHQFRRFYLEHALDHGMSIYAAAAIAGHASIQVTAEYGGGASIDATTRAVRALDFGQARKGPDGRTWVRTKAQSQEPDHAVDSEPVEPSSAEGES